MIPALSRPSIWGAILPAAHSPMTAPASAAASGQELVQVATPACNTLTRAQTAWNCIRGIRAEAYGVPFLSDFCRIKGVATTRHRNMEEPGKQRGTTRHRRSRALRCHSAPSPFSNTPAEIKANLRTQLWEAKLHTSVIHQTKKQL
jgi:hypothetical protein